MSRQEFSIIFFPRRLASNGEYTRCYYCRRHLLAIVYSRNSPVWQDSNPRNRPYSVVTGLSHQSTGAATGYGRTTAGVHGMSTPPTPSTTCSLGPLSSPLPLPRFERCYFYRQKALLQRCNYGRAFGGIGNDADFVQVKPKGGCGGSETVLAVTSMKPRVISFM